MLLVSACVPMMAGAQLILTIVLIKGEICPGQRGRDPSAFTHLRVFWLMIGVVHLAAFLLAGLIGYFYAQSENGKNPRGRAETRPLSCQCRGHLDGDR
ncbi:hypothetical protein P4S72_17695 [Vibrio sp. PP-XX7]